MYWVSGKAGSGKSTFMKHILDSPRTEECLKTWAGDDFLSIATISFWDSGTREQKSQISSFILGSLSILGACSHCAPKGVDRLLAIQDPS